MIPIFQTRFGNFDNPQAERGNCMQAALASIFEIPLEDAYDFTQYATHPEDTTWWDYFKEWLKVRNLWPLQIQISKGPIPCTEIEGYHLFTVKSKLHLDSFHVIVGYKGSPIFDPNPDNASVNKNDYELEDITLFLPLHVTKFSIEVPV